MKAVRFTLWSVIATLIVGNAWHVARHKSIGLFEWSARRTPEAGLQIVKTASAGPAQPADPAAAASTTSNAPATPTKASSSKADPAVISLFDGKALGKWKPIEFGGEGEVSIDEEGNLEFDFGAIMTGVKWSEAAPSKSNYEISLDAMKLDGNDFFCALTFPVKESHATFVVGGWGGGIVGVSSVDDLDASENETMNVEGFEKNVWYKIKVRVTDAKVQCWIDDKQLVDLELAEKKISLRPGDIELCVPIGIASFMTRAQYRNLQWRKLPLEAPAAAAP